MEKKVYFETKDGLKLCGILTKPEQATAKCVVLCHGISVDKEEGGSFTEIAKRLTKFGFAVFRFDFRSHGESEGNSMDLTVGGEKKDLEAAIKFLLNMGYSEFGILAASFAGGAASLFLPKHKKIVKALVLVNALIDYDSLFNPKLDWPRNYIINNAEMTLKEQGFIEIGKSKFKIGKKLVSEIKRLHPWKELQKISIPILFIHGDKDAVVPYEDSVKYSKLLKNSRLETISGAGHGFHGEDYLEQVYKLTVDFLTKNL
ncbi:alpha/beta fold hydrolase [Candidatus Woesearchaeota archaeon]|nr:alpha/beta fold hydrolase [Candidatus Woesearchaeota archaeon]